MAAAFHHVNGTRTRFLRKLYKGVFSTVYRTYDPFWDPGTNPGYIRHARVGTLAILG